MSTHTSPEPRLRCAVFAAQIGTDEIGRTNILGLMDTVDVEVTQQPFGAKLPPIPHQIFAFVRIDTNGMKGPHSFRLSFEDPNGKPLPGAGGSSPTLVGNEDGWEWKAPVVVTIDPQLPGAYRLMISVDDRVIGSIPLKVTIRRPKSIAH